MRQELLLDEITGRGRVPGFTLTEQSLQVGTESGPVIEAGVQVFDELRCRRSMSRQNGYAKYK